MLTIHRILHPTDLSRLSKHSLPVAVRLAESHGAELELFHAVVLHVGEPFEAAVQELSLDAVAEELDRLAGERLRQLDASAWAGELTVVRTTTRAVAAAPAILERAREAESDLIVMATHGRRGVQRLLIGSVTEEVLRGAPCPVLATHGNRREPEDEGVYRTILAATDFSAAAEGAVAHAVALADEYGAECHAVHVIQMIDYPGFYNPDRLNAALDVPRLRREAGQRLRTLLPTAGADECAHVCEGEAAPEILRLARRIDADLVVLGSHGLSGLDRILLGSTTERVLRSTDRDVLVVRDGGRSLV